MSFHLWCLECKAKKQCTKAKNGQRQKWATPKMDKKWLLLLEFWIDSTVPCQGKIEIKNGLKVARLVVGFGVLSQNINL